ncbi:acyl-CoA dehydrogenase family protein [Halobacteria archaeon AArc-m2/3/4]|uniref:Acyl-CoA dehydrogenase family protein n=1 Tax=Natronoglomus mannanivorans TaxID=2979990 RepID=A0AAP3E0Y7_9EURY|nr:acyl-CoA dehydrogenase family protein [Halobacteria archaeon AArc-xg1-1]MCU4971488.1 acyl-CoA dehydrogenase family protein [Halobacteria archaeon AArc-m2/3/4]
MELSDEQAAVRDVVREFAREEIRPAAAEADRTETFPEDVWDGLAELDLTGLTVPEEYGGYDADPVTYAVVNEEIAGGALAVATALSVHCLATSCLAEFATDEQQERWLPEMARGRPVGAFALSEPHAGSNPAEMSTEARRDGDEYVIDGEKQWITNGQRAGVIVLFAKTDRDDPDSITQFLVPADADGLTVGEKEDKLGLRASDTTALTFDGVRIPAENRLTEEGRGLSAAFEILTDGRIGIAAQSVGLAAHALEEALAYSQEREQFGEPISEIQTIRHKLAEMATQTEAARQLTRYAARQRTAGDGALAASMAKYFASEAAMAVTNEAVQIHGGYGYVSEFDVERLYRDAKITEIYEGTTEIQKTIIARTLLE